MVVRVDSRLRGNDGVNTIFGLCIDIYTSTLK
jgi:hypothetical protein